MKKYTTIVLFCGLILLFFNSCKKTVSFPYTKIDYTGTNFLSEARMYLSAASAGNKIVFAGGATTTGTSKTADIYDVSSNEWTTGQLSEAREILSAAAAGNRAASHRPCGYGTRRSARTRARSG